MAGEAYCNVGPETGAAGNSLGKVGEVAGAAGAVASA